MNNQATPLETPITPKVIPNKPDAQEYANDYVFRGGGDEYYPNAQEQELIQDALIGFEEEFNPIIDALTSEVEQLKAEIERLKAAQEWQPIESAPTDHRFLAAIEVQNNQDGSSWWQVDVIGMDDVTGEIWDEDYRGWNFRDYDLWMPLPTPKTKGETSCKNGV